MSKDTARQEVEQVCFAFEKAGKTGNKKDWGKFYDLEEPLIKKVEFANQPKLSIPKKIAEIFEKYDEREFESFEEEEFWIEENGLTKWIYDSESNQLMTAYLNPLTRPFVEVTGE
ncbi:hypothetical protein C9I44_06640 [Lactococcus garvieae]|nr:hypothetical protein C9I44_02385 [Lactococcus garvieae]UHU66964.1 hypothetical protein C9I44_06640 [Lactococcus garvieae]